MKDFHRLFMQYIQNTAASVRESGVKLSEKLAKSYGEKWIIQDYMPFVLAAYDVDKKGYNYRMCCLKSLAIVMPYVGKNHIVEKMVPVFKKAA